MVRLWIAKTALAMILALLCLRSGTAGAGQGPHIAIARPASAWNSNHSMPVYIDIATRQGGEFHISASIEGRNKMALRQTVTMPPNANRRVELTLPWRGYGFLRVEGLGEEEQVPLYGRTEGRNAFLLGVNSFLVREVEVLDESQKPPGLGVEALPLGELPGRWQSYVGLVGTVVIESREAGRLRNDQREALLRWVRWGGGAVWIAGAGAGEQAGELGFSLPASGRTLPGGVARYRQLNGLLFVQERPDAAELVRHMPTGTPISPLHGFLDGSSGYHEESPGNRLRLLFPGLSTNILVAVLVALGLAMGPLNYWYITRKKNSLLFFVTTPLIALTGTVGIFIASMLGEGLSGSYNQFAVLVRDDAGTDAMLFDARAVKPGLFAPTPVFSGESMAFPMRSYGDGVDVVSDVTNDLVLAGGWVRPRFATGFMVARPVVSRLNATLAEDGDRWYVTNDTGFVMTSVVALLPTGSYGWAANIPAGGKAPLVEGGSERMRRLVDQAKANVFGNAEPFRRVTMAALCEGLPYVEDGGLGAQAAQTTFCLMTVSDGATEGSDD